MILAILGEGMPKYVKIADGKISQTNLSWEMHGF
jgi:hypothetical protein